MRSRVLVTGATGFIGHYIVRQLLASGHEVSVLVRESSSHFDSLKPFGDHVHICRGDINQVESLEAACHGMDIVVHAAAMVSFDSGESRKVMKVNVEGTANLINVCLDHQVKHFIHLSSIAALGGMPGEMVIDESAVWMDKNVSLYSKSKHLAELEVWRGAAEGLAVTILNPSLVLGPWETSHHSMQIFKAMDRNLPFYPSGSNGFVDVRDVAQAVILSIEKKVFQERIIINGHNESYRDILSGIAHKMGKNKPQWLFPKSGAQLGAMFIRMIAFITGRKHYFHSSVLKSIYTNTSFNNIKSINQLGLRYTPLDQTLHDVISRFADLKNSVIA